jgi:hypothetical protein
VKSQAPHKPHHPRIIAAVLRPLEDVEALANMSKGQRACFGI